MEGSENDSNEEDDEGVEKPTVKKQNAMEALEQLRIFFEMIESDSCVFDLISNLEKNVAKPSAGKQSKFSFKSYLFQLEKKTGCSYVMNVKNTNMHTVYIDENGAIRIKLNINIVNRPRPQKAETLTENRTKSLLRTECHVWLKFISIFWSTRILKAAIKFSLVALIMNRYERLGFALLMLCVAL
ncbi:hypothetical protein FQA39_LY09198 [Lamprigera yunnana]|nr:hypothetical protein FQA39_LY09198 [Lamprigera yunnana]